MNNHEHRFFMFQVKAEFVPTDIVPGMALYERVEIAILACNCGEAIRTRVKDADNSA